jgi:Uma2 family endonuclease
MASCVVLEEQIEIPLGISSLLDFQTWSRGGDFPQTGRIDYVDGRIEVDMSPEELYSHGTVKAKLCAVLQQLVDEEDLGELFVDRTRVSHAGANLSAEPDLVFVSWASLETGRVRPVPKIGSGEDRYIELEGAPDLVVEIASDSSLAKDTRRLPQRYFAAGVAEFWFIDARGKPLVFQIHCRGARRFEPVPADADGLQRSQLFARSFRLERRKNRMNHWRYQLHIASDR